VVAVEYKRVFLLCRSVTRHSKLSAMTGAVRHYNKAAKQMHIS